MTLSSLKCPSLLALILIVSAWGPEGQDQEIAKVPNLVQEAHYDSTSHSAKIELHNPSSKAITAFHLSIYVTYVGGLSQHRELTVDDVPQMVNLQSPLAGEAVQTGADQPTRASGALGPGSSEEISLDVPQALVAKTVKVEARADLVIYLDGTAFMDARAQPVYDQIAAQRSAMSRTFEPAILAVQHSLQPTADIHAIEAAEREIKTVAELDAARPVKQFSDSQVSDIVSDLALMARDAAGQAKDERIYLREYAEVLRRRAEVAAANAKLVPPMIINTEIARGAKQSYPMRVTEAGSGGAVGGLGIRWSTHPYVPTPNKIQVRSNLVVADAVVRSANGKVVRGLRQEDFSIFDNGKPQRISYFSVEDSQSKTSDSHNMQRVYSKQGSSDEAQPRHIALIFDDLSVSPAELRSSRDKAANFISEGSLPSDQFGVFAVSSTVLQTFTEDRKAIAGALEKLSSHQRQATRPGSCPRIGAYQASAMQSFYLEHLPELDVALAEAAACPNSECPPNMGDQISCVQSKAQQILSISEENGQELLATLDSVIRSLQAAGGSRVLVLLSSGFWTQTLSRQREEIIDEALRAGVAINTLDLKGMSGSSEFGAADQGPPIALTGAYESLAADYRVRDRELLDDSMAQLAQGTGGAFLHNTNDFSAELRAAAAAPEVTYILGFEPYSKSDGKFHNLKVSVNGHTGSEISARKGYFALQGGSAAMAPAARRDEMNRALQARDSRRALASDVSPAVLTDPNGKKSLNVGVWIGIQKLPFAARNGRRAEQVIVVAALFTSGGEFVSATEGVLALDLSAEQQKQLEAKGLNAALSVPANTGNFHLRVVLQEEGNGLISAFSQQIEIR
ncbi:MAG TPA: VWA domain-containing protein [Candidatus Acidoferrales bacterium]|nr:VWA domain-containing protein [Candidatus Acidoferrales bacterium]